MIGGEKGRGVGFGQYVSFHQVDLENESLPILPQAGDQRLADAQAGRAVGGSLRYRG